MAKTKTNLQIQSNQTPQLTLTNNKLKLSLDDMKTIKPLSREKLIYEEPTESMQ